MPALSFHLESERFSYPFIFKLWCWCYLNSLTWHTMSPESMFLFFKGHDKVTCSLATEWFFQSAVLIWSCDQKRSPIDVCLLQINEPKSLPSFYRADDWLVIITCTCILFRGPTLLALMNHPKSVYIMF